VTAAGAPCLGQAALGRFALDPTVLYLNHGGFGALPRDVAAEVERLRAEMEANPTAFFAMDRLKPRLKQARAAVAAALGGSAGDWAFVENATAGANAILAGFPLRASDRILGTSHIYNAYRQTLRHHAARSGAIYEEMPIPLPYPGDDAVLAAWEVALARAPVRLAAIDHISSGPATVLPVSGMARLARAAGARVLIDGAHAPGQVAVDVPALGADWYVGNLHKWFFAPRGAAVLHAAPDAREGLHPSVLSHPYGQGFPDEFDWVGTRDLTPWLAAPAAFAFHASMGGIALMERNRRLADAAAEILVERLGTETSAPVGNRGAMVSVRLPVAGEATLDRAIRLAIRLRDEARVVAPVVPLDGRLWLRVSAQCYNGLEDYRRLADLLPDYLT